MPNPDGTPTDAEVQAMSQPGWMPPPTVSPAQTIGADTGAGLPQGSGDGVIPELEGTPDALGANNDSTKGVLASELMQKSLSPYLPNPTQAPGNTLVPSYADYSGPTRSGWEDAFVTKPAQIEKSVMEGADAEGRLGEAKAEWYKNQQLQDQSDLAHLTQNRADNQALVEQAQQKLEAKTQQYSNELSDAGKMWHTPDRIMAAISAFFMGIGGGDSLAPVKILNDAINADFQKRKQLADMHLGELRSNVGTYRAIAGDKDLGDRLAYAESKRTAAMELERIAAQFQGPLAKAKAATAVKSLLRDVDVQMMQLRVAMVHHNASFQDPRMAKELQAQGAGMPAGEGPTPDKGFWNAGFPVSKGQSGASGGTSGMSGGASGSGTGSVPPSGIPAVVTGQGGYLDPDQKKFMEARVPGSTDQIEAVRRSVTSHLLAKAGADPGLSSLSPSQIAAKLTPAQRALYNKENATYQNELSQDNAKIQVAMQPIAKRMSAYRTLGKQLDVLEMTAKQLSKQTGTEVSPDKLLDTRYAQIFGSGNVKKAAEWLAAGSKPTEAHEAQARNLQQAINTFKQIRAGNISAWVQATSGGTVSEGEDARNREFIASDHSFQSLRGFQQFVSQGAQAEAKTALMAARSNVTRLIWQASIGMEDPTLGHQGIKGYDKKAAAKIAAEKLSSGGQTVKPGPQSRADSSSYDPSLMSQQPANSSSSGDLYSPEVLRQATDSLKRGGNNPSWLKTQ